MSLLPLRTARLTLRTMVPADAPTLAAYRNDADVARYQEWPMPYLPADAERMLSGQADVHDVTRGQWVQIAVEHDGVVVGDVAVGWDDSGAVPVLGYTLSPAAQGKGFAAEAVEAIVDGLFAEFGVHRITASLDPQNVASMRVIEPLGFRLEGTSRRSELIRGEWLDDMRFGLLREWRDEWSGRPRGRPSTVTLVEITEQNLDAVGALATFEHQRRFVADMPRSLAQALVPPSNDGHPVTPWFRAIDADGEIAGFVMLATASDREPAPYLWRLLIDRRHQRRGIGELVLSQLVDRARADGATAIIVSYVEAPGGPKPFYDRAGFIPTGVFHDGQTEARLPL
jgi:RimJ/RimL family protein N-acetyltransferase